VVCIKPLLNKGLLSIVQTLIVQLNSTGDKLLALRKRKGRQFLKDFGEAHESKNSMLSCIRIRNLFAPMDAHQEETSPNP